MESAEQQQSKRRLFQESPEGTLQSHCPEEMLGDTEILPDEVLNDILRRVSMDMGSQALRYMEVCKRWEEEGRLSIVRLNLRSSRPRHFIEGVPRFPNLTHLALEECIVGCFGWSLLAWECRQLSTICLQKVSPELSSSDVTSLLAGRTNLEHLQISDSLESHDVPGLQTLTSLLSLDLSKNRHLQSLPPLDALTRMTSLSLKNCWSLQTAPGLHTLTQLRTLDLTKCISLNIPPPRVFLTLTLIHTLAMTSPNIDSPILPGMRDIFIFPRNDVPVPQPWPPLPNLQHFSLIDSPNATDLPTFTNPKGPLRSATIAWCGSLTTISPLAEFPTLQQLHISWCSSLTSIAPLANFPNLQSLHISCCRQLHEWEPLHSLINLQALTIVQCSIPELTITPSLSNLTSLNLSRSLTLTGISFPSTLPRLQSLSLTDCTYLTKVHSLSNLPSLRTLRFSGCRSVTDFEPLDRLTNLRDIQLTGCVSHDVISSLGVLPSLYKLDVHDTSPPDIETGFHLLLPTTLQSLTLNFHRTPCSVQPLPSLHDLMLRDMKEPNCLERLMAARLTSLHAIKLIRCESLTSVEPLSDIPTLQSLHIAHCKSLEILPDLSQIMSLESLYILHCNAVVELPPIRGLPHLKSLSVHLCLHLERMPCLADLPRLHSLHIQHCLSLTTLGLFDGLTALGRIDLRYAYSLKRLSVSDLTTLPALHDLNLRSCRSLEELLPLSSVPALETLDLTGCLTLTRLPLLDGLQWLREVNVEGGVIINERDQTACIVYHNRHGE